AGIGEHADRLAGHVVRDVEQRVQIGFGPPTRLDAPEDLGGPRGALPARSALSARFVGVEVHHPAYLLDDVGGIVHHDDGAAPEHRADLRHRLVIHPYVELVGGHDRYRAASGDHRLDLAALRRAPADVV